MWIGGAHYDFRPLYNAVFDGLELKQDSENVIVSVPCISTVEGREPEWSNPQIKCGEVPEYTLV